MSRRVVIAILVVLIIGILGGTVALITQRFGGDPAPDSGETSRSGTGLEPADQGGQQLADPNGDDDSDGLTNAEESVWRTDPKVADTDGDGYSDYEEVVARHNPTVAGPNDKLPDDFVPGLDLKPLDQAPIQVDQYFADNLDLDGPDENLTEKFQQQYEEEARNPIALANFTKSQPIVTQLPKPNDNIIQPATANSTGDLALYLAKAGDLSVLSDRQGLDKALFDLAKNQDPSGAQSMAFAVRRYQETLFETRVPTEAMSVHRLLLGYTELVAASFDQMAVWNEDPLKSMLAMRQLQEANDKFFPIISAEMDRLKSQITR